MSLNLLEAASIPRQSASFSCGFSSVSLGAHFFGAPLLSSRDLVHVIRRAHVEMSSFSESSTTMKPPLEEFGHVRKEMEDFSSRFHSLILDRKSSMQSKKQQYMSQIKTLETRRLKLQDEIESIKIKKGKTSAVINSSLADLRNKQNKVEALSQQLKVLQDDKLLLRQENDTLKEQVRVLQTSLTHTQNDLEAQLRKDEEELTKFEAYLGLKIEAIEENVLNFRFFNVDANNIDSEVTCELNFGGDSFILGATSPKLRPDEVASLTRDLNTHGEIVVFLRQIRKTLRDAL